MEEKRNIFFFSLFLSKGKTLTRKKKSRRQKPFFDFIDHNDNNNNFNRMSGYDSALSIFSYVQLGYRNVRLRLAFGN